MKSSSVSEVKNNVSSTKSSFGDKFKPAAGSWECDACLVRNKSEDTVCVSCGTNKPGTTTTNTAAKESTAQGSSIKSSFGDKFKPAAGSWECNSCLVRNKSEVTVCISCGTNKDGTTSSSAQESTTNASFSFGIKNSGSGFKFGSTETPKSSFTFGIPSASQSTTVSTEEGSSGALNSLTTETSKTSFTFGLPSTAPSTAASSKEENPGALNSLTAFVFGSKTQSAETKPMTFTWQPPVLTTKPEETTPTKNSSKLGFQFGSPEKFEFSFDGVKGKTSRSRDVSVCESEEDVLDEDEGDHLYFEPIVPLPDKIEVVTGEENEDVKYCQRGKLYRMVAGEWKERGLGDVKVLSSMNDSKIRLLMRREQIHKICLNHYLTQDMKFKQKDDKSVFWGATDYSENEPVPETFALRFKTPKILSEFVQAVYDAQVKLGGNPDSLLKPQIPVSPIKESATENAEHSVVSSTSEDLDVVFEKKASEEQIRKARELMLPDNFFLYETAEPCKGCIGCDPDNFDFDSISKSKDSTEKNISFTERALNAPSLFGNKTNISGNNIFGGTTTPLTNEAKPIVSNNLFGNTSIFGGSTSSPSSIFGNNSNKPSIFGNISNTTSIFDKSAVSTPSIFGGSAPAPATTTAFSAPSFSFGSSFSNQTGGNSFSAEPTTNLFSKPTFGSTAASPAVSGSLFGSPSIVSSKENVPAQTSGLFSSVNSNEKQVSFSDIVQNSQPVFGTSGADSNVWKMRNEPVFKNASPKVDADESEDGAADDSHDPHFEPIVPLPDLVEVSTGEEGWDKLFCQRAKTFRYDAGTKQWKERGIGDFKILFNPETQRYRLLQRREQVRKIYLRHFDLTDFCNLIYKFESNYLFFQVHKLSINHYLSANLQFSPMLTSEVAWCWGTHDFSESLEGTLENLAVRFKVNITDCCPSLMAII